MNIIKPPPPPVGWWRFPGTTFQISAHRRPTRLQRWAMRAVFGFEWLEN